MMNSDYYPYGMIQPGRNFNASDYRFGFQNQEKDDEVFGSTGSFINFKYRGYDSRTGRFWSMDPLFQDYPHNSPYAFSENRVIDGVELEGLERERHRYDAVYQEGNTKIYVLTEKEVVSVSQRGSLTGVTKEYYDMDGKYERMEKIGHSKFSEMFLSDGALTGRSDIANTGGSLGGSEGAKKVADFESNLGIGLSATPLAPVGLFFKGKAALMETFIDIEDESKSTEETITNLGIRATTFLGGQKASGLIKGQVKKGLLQEGRKQTAERAVDVGVNIGGDVIEKKAIEKSEQFFKEHEEEKTK